MSDLTPNEIADYPLRTGVRGYRVEQVDELLDRVADRIEVLERQLEDAHEAVRDAERRAAESTATETTLKRTLVTAQRAAEETVSQAREEAEAILSQAREEADQLLGDARTEAAQVRDAAASEAEATRAETARARRDAEDGLLRLRGLAERFRTQLREHLDEHASLLDRIPVAPDHEVGDASDDGRGTAGGDEVEAWDRSDDRPADDTQDSALFPSNHPETGDSDDPWDFSP